jgi:hypothetical protein
MILSALLVLAVGTGSTAQFGPVNTSGRYEMGERLKLLDRAWLANRSDERRAAAVVPVTRAVTSFFSGNAPVAGKALDEARAVLEGRPLEAEDAVAVRFLPAIVAPDGMVKLEGRWAYAHLGAEPIEVRVGDAVGMLAPGGTVVLEAPAAALLPGGRREGSTEVPIRIGKRTRTAPLSVVADASSRIERLSRAENAVAATLGQLLARDLERGAGTETALPYAEILEKGEAIAEQRVRLEQVDHLHLVGHGDTLFRVAFPPRVPESDVTVVVALHGAGGSENLFFEGYGAGLAVREALRRGWVFVAPRSTSGAVQGAVDWLRDVRRLPVGKVLVMGHSMGGALTLQSGRVRPTPSAVALFAPAGRAVPADLSSVPMYLAVGQQELPPLLIGARALAESQKGRSNFEYEEFNHTEHLMIVADSLPSAFRFFDRIVASQPE